MRPNLSQKEEIDPSAAQLGSSRTIQLRGGGSATLSFDVDVWLMTPEDQQFVFEMIKRVTEYENGSVGVESTREKFSS